MRNIIIMILANILVVTGLATAAVTSFTLVNADTNANIQTIRNGAVVNLSALGTTNLNIRANVDSVPSNVVIRLSGATSLTQTEGVAPYALWGDASGNYAAGSLNLGQHTLSGTPAGGSAFTVNFTVANSVTGPPTVSAGPDKALTLPANNITLNGIASDDGSIASYTWTQKSGPSTATLSGRNAAVLTASNLIAGNYVMRLTVTDNDSNSVSDEVQIVVNNPTSSTTGVYQESGGVVIMEFENTESDLGLWTEKTSLRGYTGDGYLEFTGNIPTHGPAKSPLEYEFKIHTAGLYYLHLHCARETLVIDGEVRWEVANDGYVRVEGDYNEGPNAGNSHGKDAPLSMLKSNTKFFGGNDNQFVWASGNRLDPGGDDNKRVAIYNFKAGETYKLVVSGRSQLFKVNRLMFRHKDVSSSTAQYLSNPESARSTGGSLIYNARQDFPDANEGEVSYYLDAPNDALAIDASNVAHRNKFARAELAFSEGSGVYDVAITTLTEGDGESDYRLLRNGVVVATYRNPRVTAAGDLQTNVHVWRGITILTGDTLAVESKAVTNGLIPEGTGTAWARGRWRQIELSAATGGSNDDGDGSVTVQGEMKQWHRVDLRQLAVHSSEQAAYNPFSNYRMDVTFTAPSGKTYLVPGYFATDGNGADEGNIWMAHLNPSETGQWSYNVSFREGADVAVNLDANAGSALSPFNGKTGTFVVSASDKTGDDLRAADKGMLINRGDHYLTYGSNGKPFLYTGPGIPENILGYRGFTNTTIGIRHRFNVHEAHWKPGDPDWNGGAGKKLIGALNYIANEGGNCLYMMSNTIGGDGKDCFPHPTSSTTKDRYDLLKLKQWDIALSHAQKKGIFLHWHLAEHETGNNTYYGGSGADNKNITNTMTVERKLRFRMLNAVFGHYNGLKWNIMEECEFATSDRTAQMEYIKAVDPYDHAVTYQAGGAGIPFNTYNSHLGETDGIDAGSFQGYASRESMFNTIQSWRTWSANSGVKWTCAWDEPQRIENDNLDEVNGYPQGRRDKMWPCLMGGGDGFMWYIQRDGRGHGFDQRIEDFTIMQKAFNWSKHVRTFLKDLPLLEMNSSLSLVASSTGTDYTLAKSNDVYAIYNDRSGTGMSLNLSGATGRFSVKWFDPRNGGALQNGTVNEVTGGGTVSLGSAPSSLNQDWAVLVKRVNGGPTPTPITVSVLATDSSATEEGQTTGRWTISRQGNTSQPLQVFFTLGGSATNLVDYRLTRTSSIAFAAGQSSQTITLTPFDDSVSNEGNETAILTISTSPNYQVGSRSGAITITDNSDGPSMQIAINSGGGAYVASDGTSYEADNYFTGGSGYVRNDAISGATDDPLYQSERFGIFSYAVPVPNGTYDVLLQFAEIYMVADNARRFNIQIEGETVIGNLDIHSKVGHDAAHNALISGITITDGVMNIASSAIIENPKISAFRITSAPPIQIGINSGGGAFIASDGTSYEADNYFTGGAEYVKNDTISSTTDDTLYQSERYGIFSYAVPVPNGSYDVLLQFAEIYMVADNARRFNIQIEGETVIGNLDIHSKVGHDAAHNALISGVTITDGVMNITSSAIIENPKISAFRITSAPPIQIGINSGGGAFVASDGTSYEADNYFTGGAEYVRNDTISSTTDDTLYQSERYGIFSYAVPVPNGSYDVLLQFAEIYMARNDARRFNIQIEGRTVIGDLDIHSKVGHDVAHDALISGINITDGVMNITSSAIIDSPTISAFRITSANTGIIDGNSDVSESQSITTPTGRGSFSEVTKFQAVGADSFLVEWNGSTSATYRVEISTDLSVWTTFAGGISGKELNSIVIATQGSKMFVRVAEE